MNDPRTRLHLLTMSSLPGTLALALFCAAPMVALPSKADNWQQNAAIESNTDYLRLEDLRSFYKFTSDTQDRRSGTRRISNGATTLLFGPEPRQLTINGVNCQLSHPTQTNERGEFLVSKTDVVKLIDPVLRPTYIARRREVKTVVIDPGHGGHDVGQQTPQVREADSTLSLARQLATQLKQRGYEVVLTREDNQYLSDQRRIDSANGAANAIFLSLHLNSGRSDYHGIETYTVAPFTPAAATGNAVAGNAAVPAASPASSTENKPTGAMPGNEQDAANAALAYALQASLVHTTGAQDGGCRRARYSLLSSIRCPAAIIELGYATHTEEGAALNTEEYRSTLALALANGVDAFAKAIKPGAKVPVTIAPPPPPPTPVKVDKPNRDEGKKADNKKKSNKGGKTIRKSKNRGKSGSQSTKRTGRKR